MKKNIFLKITFWIELGCTILSCAPTKEEVKQSVAIRTIAFYNVENLFDTKDDPHTYDHDFTPEGSYHWTEENYYDKLDNIAQVIHDIGRDQTKESPAIIGLAEVENDKVLSDLISRPILHEDNYGSIHFDSPDRRGIDVALLYKKHLFNPQSFAPKKLFLKNKTTGKRIYTRDQLVVVGKLEQDMLALIINHWPSRVGGLKRSAPLREKAAILNKEILDSLEQRYPHIKIISMGDFNDNPEDASMKNILQTQNSTSTSTRLYNPMIDLYQQGGWTLLYRNRPFLFDQIFFNASLLNKKYSGYYFWKTEIYRKTYLITPTGKYKGYPFRSFSNKKYTGGYSDHLPVYIYLIKNLSKKKDNMENT